MGSDHQMLQLVPVAPPEHKAERHLEFGSARGLIRYMAPDFDAPLEDFREYMV